MRRSARARLLAASVVALCSLAACGDDDDTAATDAPTELDATTPTATLDAGPVATADPSGTTPDDGTGSEVSEVGEVGTKEEYVAITAEQIAFADGDVGDCVAEAIITDDVYAAIQDAGISTDTFRDDGFASGITVEPEQGEAITADVAACGDLVQQVVDAGEVGDEEAACYEEHMGSDLLAEYLVTTLFSLPASDDLTTAVDAMETCVNG